LPDLPVIPQLDLELRHIRKRYGDFVAVNDVSLQVGKGQFICLLGPSGCGKTTTLRCVAGLEEPDAGDILIGGREVTGEPPWKRDIAMMFQDFALFPHMTVAKQVGARRRGAEGLRDRPSGGTPPGTAFGRAEAARRLGAGDDHRAAHPAAG
jgi:ABC-type Fe3+/spermidine/putrescine transport system ATPase subunit